MIYTYVCMRTLNLQNINGKLQKDYYFFIVTEDKVLKLNSITGKNRPLHSRNYDIIIS